MTAHSNRRSDPINAASVSTENTHINNPTPSEFIRKMYFGFHAILCYRRASARSSCVPCASTRFDALPLSAQSVEVCRSTSAVMLNLRKCVRAHPVQYCIHASTPMRPDKIRPQHPRRSVGGRATLLPFAVSQSDPASIERSATEAVQDKGTPLPLWQIVWPLLMTSSSP